MLITQYVSHKHSIDSGNRIFTDQSDKINNEFRAPTKVKSTQDCRTITIQHDHGLDKFPYIHSKSR